MHLKLANVLESYATYLRNKYVKVQRIHTTPRSNFEKKTNVTVLPQNMGDVYYQLETLNNVVKTAPLFEPISVREHLPPSIDRKQMYALTQCHLLKKGLSTKMVHYVFHAGGSKPSLHFVWKVTEKLSETELIDKCLSVVRKIEEDVPTYERRITKREFKSSYGFATSRVVLRSMFKELTGDKSAPTNVSGLEIDRRLDYAILCEDPDILVDLRNQSSDSREEKFKVFFEQTKKISSKCGWCCLSGKTPWPGALSC